MYREGFDTYDIICNFIYDFIIIIFLITSEVVIITWFYKNEKRMSKHIETSKSILNTNKIISDKNEQSLSEMSKQIESLKSTMNTNKIIAAVLQEDLVDTKKLVNEALLSRLGNALEEKLANFAPSVIGEGSKGSKPDFLDLDKDGDKEEPMKKAAKEKKDDSSLEEEKMTKGEKKEKEKIVKGMKKNKKDFEKRYPGRGEQVMYATATKKAMEK